MSSSSQTCSDDGSLACTIKSCRIPVTFALLCSLLWLVTASGLGFLAMLKFHVPGFLADSAWFTYGRLIAASKATMLFGFAFNGALAILLYLIPVVARAPLAQSGLTTTALLIGNSGIKLGFFAILLGYGESFEWLALPKFAVVTCLFSYLIVAVTATLSFHNRSTKEADSTLVASFLGLLWIPWALSVYGLLFDPASLRGVMYSVVGWWISNQLIFIVPSVLIIALAFKYVPVVSGEPVKDSAMGRLGLWVLVFAGSLAGVSHGVPVAMGIPAISAAGTLLTLVAVVALMYMFHSNFYASYGKGFSDGKFRFIAIAVDVLLLTWILRALGAWYPIADVVGVTTYNESLAWLILVGGFMMAIFGLVFYVSPRLLEGTCCSAGKSKAAFWCGLLGALILFAAFGIGGLVQGKAIGNPDVATAEAVGSILTFIRLAVTGHLLVLAASIIVSWYFISAIIRTICSCCCSTKSDTCSSQTAEVTA